MTLMPHCVSHTAGSVARMSPPVATPALLNSTSTGPSRSSTSATIAFTDDSSLTSHATPMPLLSAAIASAPSALRSTTATSAPAAAHARLHAAPMPLPPPVTIATLAVSSTGLLRREALAAAEPDPPAVEHRVLDDRDGELGVLLRAAHALRV